MAFNDLYGGKFKSQYVLASKKAAIVGVTKDAAGAALGACTVLAFRTSTNVFLAQTVSDGSGNYNVGVPFGSTCFVVAYKAGAPDVTGGSVNTLVGVGGY